MSQRRCNEPLHISDVLDNFLESFTVVESYDEPTVEEEMPVSENQKS